MAGFLDRLVETAARVIDALGGNGARLRWKWNQRRRTIGEAGAQAEQVVRSARQRHKMCRSCRALVDRRASRCSECGASLSGVSTPGLGRTVGNLLPGATNATSLLLLANGVLFGLTLILALRSESGGGLGSILMFPSEFTVELIRLGAFWSDLVVHEGEWWRFVTAMFLHGGLVHWAFNSYVLLQIAPIAEQLFDAPRMFVAYLFAGIAGFFGTLVWSFVAGHGLSVGASGAILGLMGFLVAYGFRTPGGAGRAVRSLIGQYVIFIFITSLFFGRIDHAAHVAGFLGGALAGFVIPSGPHRSDRARVLWDVAAWAGVLLVVACFGLAVLSMPS